MVGLARFRSEACCWDFDTDSIDPNYHLSKSLLSQDLRPPPQGFAASDSRMEPEGDPC